MESFGGFGREKTEEAEGNILSMLETEFAEDLVGISDDGTITPVVRDAAKRLEGVLAGSADEWASWDSSKKEEIVRDIDTIANSAQFESRKQGADSKWGQIKQRASVARGFFSRL